MPLPAEIGAFLAGGAFFVGVAIFLPEVTAFGAEEVLGFFGFNSSGDTSFPPFLFFNSSGWMLGRTPPEAIVTPFSNLWEKWNYISCYIHASCICRAKSQNEFQL